MEGLTGNSKPTYEICDSKSEKSAPMYCFTGTSLCYSVFVWIVGLTNLAQYTLATAAKSNEKLVNQRLCYTVLILNAL